LLFFIEDVAKQKIIGSTQFTQNAHQHLILSAIALFDTLNGGCGVFCVFRDGLKNRLVFIGSFLSILERI
jgi:hypothetical protein